MAFVRVDFFSKSLMRTVTINAIIPVDKMQFPGMPVREKKPFKTLYLLHGIFGNYVDWVNGTRIERWAQDNNLAVIMPSGENKFYVDNEASGDMFSTFIGKELVEVTRDMFPLSHERQDTFIGGLSMGGYGALTNGLKYHDTFGYIVALSSGLILERVLASDDSPNPMPTHRRSYYESVFGDLDKLIGSDMDYNALAKKVKDEKNKPAIYLACGTEDALYPPNVEYRKLLEKYGYDVTWVEGPGGHTWDFWDEYLLKALKWLPLETKTESIHSGHIKTD
ncbi:MAG: acetylesterase [Erysipelotrichaceae bacterium]|nr:acetylesterase [Erysipelotrichaceae bacterium]